MDRQKEISNICDFIAGNSKEEYSFVALKPDATNLDALDIVAQTLLQNGYEIAYYSPVVYTAENVQVHYKEIYDGFVQDPDGRFAFYPTLEAYLTSGPIFGIVVKGHNAVAGVKQLCGATRNPAPGSMRYELFKKINKQYDTTYNGIHASGQVNEAMREIKNFLEADYYSADYNKEQLSELNPLTEYMNNLSSENVANTEIDQ